MVLKKIVENSFLSINKKAGIVSISVTSKKHKEVAKYIQQVKQNATSQVLIEAKIIEVSLNDSFQTGINWSRIVEDGNTANLTPSFSTAQPISIIFRNSEGSSNRINSTISFLKEFGTTRTLFSPRIIALNNQQAVLSFTENEVYFEIEFQSGTSISSGSGTTSNASSTGPTINSTLKTIPIGVILTLQPSIDLEKNEILLNIKPTISSSDSTVSDPAVSIAIASEIASADSGATGALTK